MVAVQIVHCRYGIYFYLYMYLHFAASKGGGPSGRESNGGNSRAEDCKPTSTSGDSYHLLIFSKSFC